MMRIQWSPEKTQHSIRSQRTLLVPAMPLSDLGKVTSPPWALVCASLKWGDWAKSEVSSLSLGMRVLTVYHWHKWSPQMRLVGPQILPLLGYLLTPKTMGASRKGVWVPRTTAFPAHWGTSMISPLFEWLHTICKVLSYIPFHVI